MFHIEHIGHLPQHDMSDHEHTIHPFDQQDVTEFKVKETQKSRIFLFSFGMDFKVKFERRCLFYFKFHYIMKRRKEQEETRRRASELLKLYSRFPNNRHGAQTFK